jgi:hypothetical protein
MWWDIVHGLFYYRATVAFAGCETPSKYHPNACRNISPYKDSIVDLYIYVCAYSNHEKEAEFESFEL